MNQERHRHQSAFSLQKIFSIYNESLFLGIHASKDTNAIDIDIVIICPPTPFKF